MQNQRSFTALCRLLRVQEALQSLPTGRVARVEGQRTAVHLERARDVVQVLALQIAQLGEELEPFAIALRDVQVTLQRCAELVPVGSVAEQRFECAERGTTRTELGNQGL